MKACNRCGSYRIVAEKCHECGGIEIMECKMYTLPKMTSMLDRHEAEGIEVLDILDGVGCDIDSIKEWMRDTSSTLADYKEMLSLHLALGGELDARISALEELMLRKADRQVMLGGGNRYGGVALLKSEPESTEELDSLKKLYKYHDSLIGGTNPFKSLIKQVSAQHGENLMSVAVDELDLEKMTKFYAEHKACGAGNIMLDCASTGIGSCVDIRCVSCGKVQTIYGPETW